MLLDILAGKKTNGKIKGSVLINGKDPSDDICFNRITGYVEQSEAKTLSVLSILNHII